MRGHSESGRTSRPARDAAAAARRRSTGPYALYLGKLAPNKGTVASRRRRHAGRARLAAGDRRRRAGARRARAAGARGPAATSGSPAGSIRTQPRLAGACVDADLSVARAGIAQPRADRSQRARRADRRDEHRRHARHRRRTRTPACSPTRRRSSRTTCGGCGRTRSCDGGSARRPRRHADERFDAPAVVARIEQLYRELLGARGMSRPLASRSSRARSFRSTGYGGLERHVYDLVRAPGATRRRGHADHAAADGTAGWPIGRRRRIHPRITLTYVPYRTFPFAGRRGTTVLDRSTAYPLFGERAGRVALELVRAGAGRHRPRPRRERARLRAAARAERRRRRWC